MSGNLATIYNELMKVKIDINDLQRASADLYRIGDDVSSLKIFRDVYRADIIRANVDVVAAHNRIAEVEKGLNEFISTFNGWADLIRQLQTDVGALKKENTELRTQLKTPISVSSSSAKSVTSTTAVVGAPSSSAKSVTFTTAVVEATTKKK